MTSQEVAFMNAQSTVHLEVHGNLVYSPKAGMLPKSAENERPWNICIK